MLPAAAAAFLVLPVEWPSQAGKLFVGFALLVFPMWVFMAPLAIWAAGACRELWVVDVVMATVILFILLQSVFMVAMLDAPNPRAVDGEPCNGGAGRKLVTANPDPRPGSPVYWACVSVADYEARRQAEPAPSAPGRDWNLLFGEAFGRLVKLHFASRSLVFGTVAALTAWLFAFGWRWRVRTDEL